MVWWSIQKTMRFSFYKNVDEGVRAGDNYEGRPGPDDQVANEGRRNIDNVGNGSGSDSHGSKSNKMLRRISSIGWGDGGVLEGIGTYPVDSMCLIDLSPVRRCFV